jgi:hypothetical protein
MSGFKAEFWSGHWYDLGYVFSTCQEASGFAIDQGRPMRVYRVVPTDDKVNYQWDGKRLLPYSNNQIPISWEAYVNGLP